MAVHYQGSQADGWVYKGHISPEGATYRVIRKMEKEVVPQLDGIVYVSRATREHLLEWIPEAANIRSAIIPNFVKPLEARVPEKPLADVVSVGSLQKGKNHRFLLEVLEAANRVGRRITLDIYGAGGEKKGLVALRHTLGLDDQVRLRGFEPGVRLLLPGYRAYVHASFSENCPLAVIEAMGAGLPVIAGGFAAMAELYREGVEGRFWPLDDPVRAAAILIELLDCEPVRQAAASAALERFASQFDERVVAPRLACFLLEGATSP